MARKNLNAAQQGKTPSAIVLDTVLNSASECKMPSHASEEERKEQFEKYHLTGEFEKDIVELSSILNLPIHVSHRIKLPLNQETSTITTSGKNKDDKKKDTSGPTHEGSDCNVAVSLTPTTFLVTENKEYFKAKITIDAETEGNKTYVKEVSLRGWLAEERVMNMLSKTFSYLDKLYHLDMWRAGLTDKTLIQLYESIKSSSSLKTLSLDGNDLVKNQQFDIFIRSKTDGKLALQNYSLRNCGINETGASHLGSSLSENTSLFSLNLNCNLLGDAGANHIADGLRMNRTLLSLNLASNRIGDKGADTIAHVLKSFPLNHEEIVARRFMITTFHSEESIVDDNTCSPKSGKKSKESKQPKRPESTTTTKGGGAAGGGKLEITNSDAHKKSKVNKRGRRASKTSEHGESPVPEDYEPIHPFLEKVKPTNDGKLWIPGNRTLINLNLSRNEITVSGLGLLYSAMQYQSILALENRVIGGILRRMSLQRNSFSCEDSTFIAFDELMKRRDPLYKPSLENCEEETMT